MADGCRRGAGREVHARDQGIGGGDQLRIARHLQQRGVVADTGYDVRTACAAGAEVTVDEREFPERHALSAACQCSPGRKVRAARSSTAFTNLCPSVAPKRLASPTASLMTTR